MVLRAVLAVLTLLGAVPFRVCTCGASHVHHKAAAPPAHHSHPGCAGHEQTDTAPRHDHDCPAVKPRAAMPQAVTATVAEPPTVTPLIIALDEVAPLLPMIATADAEPRSPDPPPDRPLYLTLRTLRN